MLTSKYRRLSSWGTALIPGTLYKSDNVELIEPHAATHGSAINRSVSLIIRFGSAIALLCVPMCH